MMYAALAVALTAGLCWDFGRRWLVTHERAVEAALIRESEIRGEFMDKHGDLASVMNLRVRELSDRLDETKRMVVNAAEYTEKFETEHRGRIEKLEQRPAESTDMAKHNAAVLNLGKQLGELSAHVTDEFKKVRTAQAGIVGTGRRFVG